MNSEFFRTSTTWVVDFHYDGRPRRWFKAFGANVNVKSEMTDQLQDLYGGRARLVDVRPATEEEESAYLRGTEPKNVMCPTGRRGPRMMSPECQAGGLRSADQVRSIKTALAA